MAEGLYQRASRPRGRAAMHRTANPATPVRLRARPPGRSSPMTGDPAASAFPRHGGHLAFATARYGAPAEGWLDLSTGINPRGYPVTDPKGAALAALPQAGTLAELLAAARAAYGFPQEVSVIATGGSEAAIALLPVITPSGRAAIVSPTYASHGDAWRSAGRDAAAVASLAEVSSDVAVVIVVNPNNPDGRLVQPETLVDVAAAVARWNGLLVVDEAFADVAREVSVARYLDGMRAVVLRSFGKFFGLPGLRLGFAAGPADVIGRLRSLLG